MTDTKILRSTTPKRKTPKKRVEPTPAHLLYVHTEEAKSMLADMGDILSDGMAPDFIEGQTSLHEVMGIAVRRMLEIDTLLGGIEVTIKTVQARQHRLKEQQALLRTRLAVAMEIAAVERLELPLATVSYRKTPQQVRLIDESLIPSAYWKPQDPRLDKKAVLSDLKAGKEVPGTMLDNGSSTVALTTR